MPNVSQQSLIDIVPINIFENGLSHFEYAISLIKIQLKTLIFSQNLLSFYIV